MSGNEEAQFSLNALESQDILNNHKQLKAKYKLKIQKIYNEYKKALDFILEFRNELASFRNILLQKNIFERELDQLKNFVESQLESKNKLIQSLKKKCAELTENLSAAQKQESDSQLKQENKKLNGQIQEITQKIQSLEKELEKQKSANIILQKKLQEAETDINHKSEYIQVIEKDFESEKKSLQNQIVQLQRENQVNQLQDKSITQILDEQGQKQSQILQQQQKAGAQLDQFPSLNEKLDYLQKSINGDYLRKIKELEDQYAVLRNENEQLKQQVNKSKQDIQKNDQLAILNEKKQELEQKNQQILDLQQIISEKASKIEFFERKLCGIGEFVEQQNNYRKQQYEVEHDQIQTIHLEGYFKLQEKSILFIFVGLKIYKQYLNSESRDIKNVEKALEDLTKFNTNFQKKDNFIQKDKRTLEKYYNNCLNDLNVLYESTLQSFKNLINELKQRNNEF